MTKLQPEVSILPVRSGRSMRKTLQALWASAYKRARLRRGVPRAEVDG